MGILEEKKQAYISFPVEIYENENKVYIIPLNHLSYVSFVAYGDTYAEAEKQFINNMIFNNIYTYTHEYKYEKLILFKKGDWSHIGGTWFMILGFQFYFRKRNNKYPLNGGKNIPFTNLNITFINYWSKKRKKRFEEKIEKLKNEIK